MTESDANIYFLTYKALLEDIDNPANSGQAAFINTQP